MRFSILVPVYETGEDLLRAMIGSVLAQTYGNFELILADASKSEEPEKIIASYQDKRIMYKRIRQNGGISANTNQALMYATGDYAAQKELNRHSGKILNYRCCILMKTNAMGMLPIILNHIEKKTLILI